MLYLASQKIVERWTQRCRNWDVVLNQLSIMFEGRISAWFVPDNRISRPQNVIHALACITFSEQEELLTRGKSGRLHFTTIRYSIIVWRIIIYTKYYRVPKIIVLVMDNLNAHKSSSLYNTFPTEGAFKIIQNRKCTIHKSMVLGWILLKLNYLL